MRKLDICRDCMWITLDTAGDCWDFCKGRFRPGTRIKKIPTIYHVDSLNKLIKVFSLLQIDDYIIFDEDGMVEYGKT
jgi:hypothetical protein